MSNYYYLASLLPPLDFPSQGDIGLEGLEEALRINLSSEDMEQVRVLRLQVDLSNIQLLLQEEEIDPRGNLDEKALEEVLLEQTFFPEYVWDFLQTHETLVQRARYFPALLHQFFEEEASKHTGFLRAFFTFEREWRLVMLALRAKKLRRDVVTELQFEDPTDPLIMHILAQKDAEQYEPPLEYKELKDLWVSCGPDPWQQAKSIASYRFRKIHDIAEEVTEGLQFTMCLILAYLAQLMIVEQWRGLSEQRGRLFLDRVKTS